MSRRLAIALTSLALLRACSAPPQRSTAAQPPVTPARVPVQNLMRIELQGKWGELGHFVSLANARIWERVAETCSRSEDYSLFWQLATIYSAPLLWMRRKVIWKHIGPSNSG